MKNVRANGIPYVSENAGELPPDRSRMVISQPGQVRSLSDECVMSKRKRRRNDV